MCDAISLEQGPAQHVHVLYRQTVMHGALLVTQVLFSLASFTVVNEYQ